MKDKSHDDAVERWAYFVKNNPKTWKKIHSEFIDAQFIMSERFYDNLKKTKKGRDKIIKLFNIKNLKGYPSLTA